MIDPRSPQEVVGHLKEQREAYAPIQSTLALYCARAACYDAGIQWMFSDGSTGSRRLGQMFTNWNLDGNQPLRITDNQITTLRTKLAAQTAPTSITPDILPPERDLSPESTHAAQVLESMAYTMIEKTGMVEARREANDRRTIMGQYYVGLAVETGMRILEGREEPDARMRCFTTHPCQFTLDPHQTSRCLRDHDAVWWSDVWTAAKIKRTWNIELDESDLRTVGELTPTEHDLNRISDGMLFAQYQRYSKTKGARIHQGHYKDANGRFSRMFLMVETGNGDKGVEGMIPVNADNPESPFGGDGLPWAGYYGHRRADGAFCISDVWMMIDDQDRLNLMESMFHRWAQRSAAWKLLVDKASLRGSGTEERLRQQWNNIPGGLVVFDTGGVRGAMAPNIVQFPAPPQFVNDKSEQYRSQMERKVHRPEISLGATKSHVPDASYQAALEQADQVGNVRVKEDVKEDAAFIRMLIGTTVRLAQQGSPSVLATLSTAGFDEQDYGAILSIDPDNIPCRITVRESSVRNRSIESRRQDLIAGVQNQVIDPYTARLALVQDIDAPLADRDRQMEQAATRAAMRVVAGEQWEPLPLGQDSVFFIEAFKSALVSSHVLRDPGARQRLAHAIQLQELAAAPLVAPNPEQSQAPTAEQAQGLETMTIGDALAGAASPAPQAA